MARSIYIKKFTVVAIMSSIEGSEENEVYRIKPKGRGRTKVVNGSKLKRAFGPHTKSSIELTKKRTIDRHLDEVIDEVARGENTVPSDIHTTNEN